MQGSISFGLQQELYKLEPKFRMMLPPICYHYHHSHHHQNIPTHHALYLCLFFFSLSQSRVMTILFVISNLRFGWQGSSSMLSLAPPFQLVLTVLLLMSWCQTKAAEDHLISKLVQSIEKASVFFDNYQTNINIDGLFGIQVGQGEYGLFQLISNHDEYEANK